MSSAGDASDIFRELLQGLGSQAAAEATVTGSAGGGAVTVQMKGDRVTSVVISAEVVGDVPLLGELVAAAVNDALARAASISLESAQQLLTRLPLARFQVADLPDRPEAADSGPS